MQRHSIVITCFLAFSSCLLLAQSPVSSGLKITAAEAPAFDVVVIRPSKSSDEAPILRPLPNGIRATGVTVLDFVRSAYELRGAERDQISGLPLWAKSTRFDIQAKIVGGQSEDLLKFGKDRQEKTLNAMVQTLLADRFQLKVHKETREIPIYELEVFKGGSKLRPGQADDPTLPNGSLRVVSGLIAAKGVSLTRFAYALELQVDRPVVDKTGLAGTYDFSLNWQPSEESTSLAATSAGNERRIDPYDTGGESIFAALHEQLGLTLRSAKGHGDILIVDHIDHPSAN